MKDTNQNKKPGPSIFPSASPAFWNEVHKKHFGLIYKKSSS